MADFYWRVQYLLTPTIGNPDDFDLTRSPAYCQFTTTVSCPFEQTFQDGFSPVSYSCVVVEAQLQPQCRRDTPHFLDCFRKFDGIVVFSFRRSLRCCRCSTAPSPHSAFVFFRRFWRHLTHRSLCFVFPVLLSSFTPATVHSSFSYILRKFDTAFANSRPQFLFLLGWPKPPLPFRRRSRPQSSPR